MSGWWDGMSWMRHVARRELDAAEAAAPFAPADIERPQITEPAQ